MADDELVYKRVLPAGRDLVFDCLTRPEHLAGFWGPEGTKTPLDGIVVELRTGGRFETLIVNDRDGSTHHMRARFDEVRPPELLAWTEPESGMATTVRFRALPGDRTEVTIVQRHVPEPNRSPEARAGFASSLDRIERYVSELEGKDR